MKKYIAAVLVLVMVLTACACGSTQSQAPVPTPTPIVIYVTPEPTATPHPVVTPAPAPSATPTPSATPRPTPTPVPYTPPVIVKDPTDEYITEGGNAYFIADAYDYNYIKWQIVSPDHSYSYDINEAHWYFQGLSVAGQDTNQLVLCNCPLSLDGWCVEATFIGYGGSVTTNHAYCFVSPAPKAQLWAYPSGGTFQGEDVAIQLNAGPNDTIHYEIYTDNIGSWSGDTYSGGYVYLDQQAMLRYTANLYAYVVGDEGNAISCQYVLSNIVLPPEIHSDDDDNHSDDPYFVGGVVNPMVGGGAIGLANPKG